MPRVKGFCQNIQVEFSPHSKKQEGYVSSTIKNRVDDFNKMVEWLMDEEGWSDAEAIEWIECNTLRAIPYFGEGAPIIMYPLPTE